MDADIAFSAGQLQVARIDWLMDERRGLPERAYEEFRRVLGDTFPEARVRVIVTAYYGEPRRYSIGRASVRIRNERYLGAQMLDHQDARAAERMLEQVIGEKFAETLRSILAVYRADVPRPEPVEDMSDDDEQADDQGDGDGGHRP